MNGHDASSALERCWAETVAELIIHASEQLIEALQRLFDLYTSLPENAPYRELVSQFLERQAVQLARSFDKELADASHRLQHIAGDAQGAGLKDAD